MKINAKTPSIKTYTLSNFKIGDVCMGEKNEHYYLVVKSEKEKKQLVDLTENEIIRDAGYMRFIPATAEVNIKDVGVKLMKNILFIVITMAIMSCMLVGCEEKESNTYKDESDTQQSAALVDINNNLSYDNSTRIVYWYFEDGAGRTSTGFMSPYISKDGRYCRYEKGKIVPVERRE